jgi:hypothetical protein
MKTKKMMGKTSYETERASKPTLMMVMTDDDEDNHDDYRHYVT